MRLEHRKPERPSRSTLAKYSTPVLLQGCLPTAIAKPTCSLDTAGFVRHIPYPIKALPEPGRYTRCAALAIIAKLFPELGPGLEQAATDENVRMVFGFFVFHPESVSSVTGQLAGGEEAVQVGPRNAYNDEGLRRGVAIR